MAIKGFELGLETDRMFADAERKREEREAGITDIQKQAQGVEPVTIKDVRDFALATAPITGDVIAFKDAPEDYTRAYELLQAGYGERDLIKMGLGGAFTGLITMGLIPGLGFVSRMGKNMLRQMAIDAFKKGDRKTGTEILVNTSDYVKKELGDKFNKNISTKRQSQIKEIKKQYIGKERKKRIKMLDKPEKVLLYHGTSMGQFTASPKVGTYIDKDFQANQLATTFRDNSKIFTEMVDANNGNPIIDINTYGMKTGKDVDEIDKYAGAKIKFPVLTTIDATRTGSMKPVEVPTVLLDTIRLEPNAEAGEVYLKGMGAPFNEYEGETYGVVKLLDNNKVDLRDIETELTKRNRQDIKEVVDLDKTFIDNLARRGFDVYDESGKTYIGMGARKPPAHAELGTQALSMSLDPITSSKPAFTTPGVAGRYTEVGDMSVGTDEMGRTIENLVYAELPYGKFKSMTPDDYNKIVNLYSRDSDLREGLLEKYKDKLVSNNTLVTSDMLLPKISELNPVTQVIIRRDNPDTVKLLFHKDEDYARASLGELKDTTVDFPDSISMQELNDSRKEVYNLTQRRLIDLPDEIDVYRVGKLNEVDGVSSFTLDKSYAKSIIEKPEMTLGRVSQEPIIRYTVKKSDILASPDFAEGIGTGRKFDEAEVIIANDKISVVPLGIKLPKSMHTEAEVAFTRPDLLTPKKVVDNPKVLANVQKANQAFDKHKKIELSIGGVDNRALIGDPVNQKKGYDLVKDYFNSALELAKFTRTEGARGGYDEIIDELGVAPNLARLIENLSIVLPKGEKKNNIKIIESLLNRKSRGRMESAPKRLKGYQDREAPKDFSAKKFINELQSTLLETKGNILDYKLATEEKILSLSPRQYKEVIMEITPKLNRGGLMTR